ncbi:hypothetical protein [Actinomadura madurae]|nr:hypothetical protein [Actinomadura madurae]
MGRRTHVDRRRHIELSDGSLSIATLVWNAESQTPVVPQSDLP